jgi:hypothetical protein
VTGTSWSKASPFFDDEFGTQQVELCHRQLEHALPFAAGQVGKHGEGKPVPGRVKRPVGPWIGGGLDVMPEVCFRHADHRAQQQAEA